MKKSIVEILLLLFGLLGLTFQIKLKNVGIYYGYLNSFNYNVNGWNNSKVILDVNRYQIFVIGRLLELPTHPDYANTLAIIPNLAATVQSFCYVDIGNTFTRTQANMMASIDACKVIGVKGVFLDEFGFDYWPNAIDMRKRQNKMIDYAHLKGLKVFANAWNPDDIFTDTLTPGIHSTIGVGDYYLAQSYIFSSAVPLNFTAHLIKMNKIKLAKTNYQIKAFGVSTTTSPTTSFNQTKFNFMTVAGQLDRLDGIGWGCTDFAASTAIMPFRAISSTQNSLPLIGSNTVNNSLKKITRSTSTGKTVTAYYGNTTYTIV